MLKENGLKIQIAFNGLWTGPREELSLASWRAFMFHRRWGISGRNERLPDFEENICSKVFAF